ncbi:MAG: hypothetical protein QXT01_02610 [Sulfolobales archaeon]
MEVSPGTLIAVKILIRGKGVYILLIVSLLLLYYSVFVKHHQITYLLILVSMLNVLTAILSDSDNHKALFYALRISGAKPSAIMTYILTVSVLITLIGLIPIVIKADIVKTLATLVVNTLASALILYYIFLKIKKHTALDVV